tara:strand:- start:386 stop:1096 length:711 start_codon:yes stop_codon:yes gene_type:complete
MPEGHEYICFGEAEAVGPWKVMPGKDCGNPIRSSRYYKINCPFESSVYVDATKLHLLKEPFFSISEEILNTYDDKMFCLEHPHRHSYLNEMMEYYNNGWWSKNEIMQYTALLKDNGFDFKKFFSPLCTILWRKNRNKFNEMWWTWYEKGGIRDQMSFSTALQALEMNFRYDDSIKFLNNFTNAGYKGEWWDTRQGDYRYHKNNDSDRVLEVLCNMTGLSSFRYKPCCRRRLYSKKS